MDGGGTRSGRNPQPGRIGACLPGIPGGSDVAARSPCHLTAQPWGRMSRNPTRPRVPRKTVGFPTVAPPVHANPRGNQHGGLVRYLSGLSGDVGRYHPKPYDRDLAVRTNSRDPCPWPPASLAAIEIEGSGQPAQAAQRPHTRYPPYTPADPPLSTSQLNFFLLLKFSCGHEVVKFPDSQHADVAHPRGGPRQTVRQIDRSQHTSHRIDLRSAEIDAALLPGETVPLEHTAV